jgi:acetylornithine deacetylase/succinyl-diaminopimelate desuccinylase-like protein
MCAEKDGFLVNALIDAYNTVTGENKRPVAMSGSTFARAFKYGCSFGPELDDGESGNLHDANEFASKKHLLTCYEIYKKAIFNLAIK